MTLHLSDYFFIAALTCLTTLVFTAVALWFFFPVVFKRTVVKHLADPDYMRGVASGFRSVMGELNHSSARIPTITDYDSFERAVVDVAKANMFIPSDSEWRKDQRGSLRLWGTTPQMAIWECLIKQSHLKRYYAIRIAERGHVDLSLLLEAAQALRPIEADQFLLTIYYELATHGVPADQMTLPSPSSNNELILPRLRPSKNGQMTEVLDEDFVEELRFMHGIKLTGLFAVYHASSLRHDLYNTPNEQPGHEEDH